MSQNIILFLLFLWLILLIFINYKYRNKIGGILNLIDKPDKIRKKHKFQVPLIGAFPLLIIFVSYFKIFEPSNIILKKILFLSFFFFFVGVLDDLYEISYVKKTIISIIILILFLNFNNELLISKAVFETFDLNINLIKSHSLIFTIICLLILINAFNFTDGINGISSIIAFFWLLGLMFLTNNTNNYLLLFSIFILINAAPIFFGKYFLGDNGTLFLGTFIGLETIRIFNFQSENIYYEQIFIIFMMPGLDMIRLVFFRLMRNKNPFLPDRNHLHHLLIERYSLLKSLLIYSSLIIIPIFLDKIFLVKSIYIIIFGIILYISTYFKLTKF